MTLKPYHALLGLAFVAIFTRPAFAFGAGNIASISSVEGQNWRHGDIEDTLLTILMARAVGGKKFNKLMVSRVYFGNWLRDYSQAIDVGTVKNVSAEAIRLLLCVLGFMSFGYGSKEFEVTAQRLGCYRPEDHIDNPKGYAEGENAKHYDRRLRGPIDERVELAVDERTGLKNYIANEIDGGYDPERGGFMTSALHVRRLFGNCIELARRYRRSQNHAEFYEALRLLGTGLHCLEGELSPLGFRQPAELSQDFLAHSNYVELALIEMGEHEVFPHVGSRTQIRLAGGRSVWPCVTGTFGGVDFLHSVTGEVSDKLTQNEIQELQGALQENSHSDTSYVAELLDKIPSGMFGGGNKKNKMNEIQQNAVNAQMENTSVSPREPEEFTRYIQQIFRQIMPAIELHDEIMKSITEAIEKIPILPQIIEQLEDQMSMWVFTIIAPFVLPVIDQVKNELGTGSSEIIASSENEQHVVFNDPYSSDPTHSMLSKDHFSNVLNEIAGKTASKVVAWVVPQIMVAWDDDNIDINRLLNRIIGGVMHHPSQRDEGRDGISEGRNIMFQSVERWWQEMDDGTRDEHRRQLSREGVLRGENHKEGVHDTGHGCGKPLSMAKNFSGGRSTQDRITSAAAGAIFSALTGEVSGLVNAATGGEINLPDSEGRGESLLGQIGSSLLGGGFNNRQKDEFETRYQHNDGSYTESRTEYGHSGDRYGQAEYSDTHFSRGGERREYSRYEQDNSGRGYGYQERVETRPSYGGGYEERTERRYESNDDSYEESSGWQRRDEDDDRYGRDGEYGRREERSDDYERSDYGRSEYGQEERGEYQQSYGYHREERQEYDGGEQEEQTDGGGFLGTIIGAVSEEMENRERRNDGGWFS
ncbi:NIMA-interacting protein tinc [Xylariaceae sp. FL0255]|nr:NIMA-interacting protein tinc [Xylariaceae sp. FL0255]